MFVFRKLRSTFQTAQQSKNYSEQIDESVDVTACYIQDIFLNIYAYKTHSALVEFLVVETL